MYVVYCQRAMFKVNDVVSKASCCGAAAGCRIEPSTSLRVAAVPAGLLNVGFLLHEHGRRLLKAWPHSKVGPGSCRGLLLLAVHALRAPLHDCWVLESLEEAVLIFCRTANPICQVFQLSCPSLQDLPHDHAFKTCCCVPLHCRPPRCGRLCRRRPSQQSQQHPTLPICSLGTGSSA